MTFYCIPFQSDAMTRVVAYWDLKVVLRSFLHCQNWVTTINSLGSCILYCKEIIKLLLSTKQISALRGICTNVLAVMMILLTLFYTVVSKSFFPTNVPTNSLSFTSSSMLKAGWNILINVYSGYDFWVTLTTLKLTIRCCKWSVALQSPTCNWSIVKPANAICALFPYYTHKIWILPSKKKLFHLLQWKPCKNDEKCFLFHLKKVWYNNNLWMKSL